jgi:predicted O-methyltransferase YrrM
MVVKGRRVAGEMARRVASRLGLALRSDVVAAQRATFEQLAALEQLQWMLRGSGPWRPFRGMAMSPDAALWVATFVRHARPGLIVECGAGTSSAVIAATASTYDVSARLVTLEHDPAWAERTRVERSNYPMAGEVRVAELRPAPGGGPRWYDEAAWQDLDEVDLLLVDGPPDPAGTGTREPVIDCLGPRLAASAVVLIDDADRPAESALIGRWLRADPALMRRDLPAEKGLCLLTRSAEALTVELSAIRAD